MTQTISWTLSTGPAPDPAEYLSPAEQQRLDGLRFPKRRQEWLLGRWTIKKLLQSCHPGCATRPLAGIEIAAETGGAPYLQIPGQSADSSIISISHRENAAACAFTPRLRMGLDLERIEPRSDAFVSDFFTAQEAARTFSLRGSERDRDTALVWSAKEAALKALRAGLRVDTRAIGIIGYAQPGSDGWGLLTYASQLPELRNARGWWRVEGARVITIAVLDQSTTPVRLKYLPIA